MNFNLMPFSWPCFGGRMLSEAATPTVPISMTLLALFDVLVQPAHPF